MHNTVNLTLQEAKKLKKQELKQKRDEYKEEQGFSAFTFENIEFNLVDNCQEEKEYWRNFLKTLIDKYNNFKEKIELGQTPEEVMNIEIEFDDFKKYKK